ncbi:Tetratricopeptide TPR_2 [Chromohalobacter israelensis DSM 3043]|uniref:Tetratricopeptide TPR_2 n=2 Tax=Chromohalobacter israelensis TaxID=141390 RepID=Q1QWZ3_CHRI1|nr:Tetratricopeptide TPR_2 [Chromohalobacter salexigens DSM 3043]
MPYPLFSSGSVRRPTLRPGRLVAGFVCLAALAGCAGPDTPNTAWTQTDGRANGIATANEEDSTTRRGACGEPMSATTGMQITLIRQMLDDDKPRAALAHLDSLSLEATGADLAEPRLLRGEALRRTGKRDAADRIYDSLTATCLAADAWRGIARNQAARGDMATALASMRKARESRPIDAAIRNDLGYLHLLEGQPRQAEEEFLTALELSPNYARAARNLIMALYAQGNARQATRIAERYSIGQDDLELLRQTRLASNATASPATARSGPTAASASATSVSATTSVPASVTDAITARRSGTSARASGGTTATRNEAETSGAITHTPIAMPDNTAFELEITRK